MTPLRSRLTNTNLINVAELHAHLRQAQKRSTQFARSQKQQLDPVSQTLQSLSSLSLNQTSGSISANHAASTISGATAVGDPEEINLNSDSDSDGQRDSSDTGADFDTTLVDDTDPDSTLAVIAESLIKLVDSELEEAEEPGNGLFGSDKSEDELDTDSSPHAAPPHAETRSRPMSSPFRFDITEVFNFEETYWCNAIISQAESSLANEEEDSAQENNE